MDLGLTNRRAIVTGGSKGLGLATVTSLIDAVGNVAASTVLLQAVSARAVDRPATIMVRDLRFDMGFSFNFAVGPLQHWFSFCAMKLENHFRPHARFSPAY